MDWKSAGRKSLGTSGRLVAIGFASLLVFFCFIRQLCAVFDLQSQGPLAADLTYRNHRFSLAQKGCNDPGLHDVAVKDGSGTQCRVSGVFSTGHDVDEQALGISLIAQDTNISNAPVAIPPVPGIHLEFERLLRTVAKTLGVSMSDSMEYAGQPAVAINFSKAPERFHFQG